MAEKFKMIIVDDQVLYRDGLCELVQHWPEFHLVGDFSNGQEAVEYCDQHEVDFILMDVQMPVMDGVEATRQILLRHPNITVVMLTVATEDARIVAALRAGARGYLLKDMSSHQLHEKLQDVLRGEGALSGIAASKLIDAIGRLDQQEHMLMGLSDERLGEPFGKNGRDDANMGMTKSGIPVGLTARETEVLELLAKGCSNDEIGAQLYMSAGTVKKRVSSIMQKLGLDNRVKLAVYAIQHGYAGLDED